MTGTGAGSGWLTGIERNAATGAVDGGTSSAGGGIPDAGGAGGAGRAGDIDLIQAVNVDSSRRRSGIWVGSPIKGYRLEV